MEAREGMREARGGELGWVSWGEFELSRGEKSQSRACGVCVCVCGWV